MSVITIPCSGTPSTCLCDICMELPSDAGKTTKKKDDDRFKLLRETKIRQMTEAESRLQEHALYAQSEKDSKQRKERQNKLNTIASTITNSFDVSEGDALAIVLREIGRRCIALNSCN